MGEFSVGAIAIASRRANAVGAVRLTCVPDGLRVELVRAARFSRGFAPAALAEDIPFRVPYAAVRGLVRDRRTLLLAFDPQVVAPHNRLSLARFSTDPAAALVGAYAARQRARLAGVTLPLLAAGLAAVAVPASLASGLVGRASTGLLAMAVTFLLLREIVVWRTWGGPRSDALRDAFEVELAGHLGLAPVATRSEVPATGVSSRAGVRAARGDLDALDVDDEQERAPASGWTRTLVAAVGLAAAAVAAIALFGRTFGLSPRHEPPLARAAPVAASADPGALAPPDAEAAPKLPACSCARADAKPWEHGLPVVSVLIFPAGEDSAEGPITPTLDRRGRGRYEFEVAAVNNSGKPVRDVRVTLTFARRNKRGERVGATDRGLFWEGALAAGRAVKWHVKAPGTEMRSEWGYVGGAVDTTLADANVEAAPPDAAYELTRSRWRPVRLRGATLLAYARDPRAAGAIEGLRALAGPAERAILDDLARAAAEIYTCDVALDADASEALGASAASACVFNGSTRAATGLQLFDARTAATIRVAGVVPTHEGVRVTWPSASSPGPIDIVDGARAGVANPSSTSVNPARPAATAPSR